MNHQRFAPTGPRAAFATLLLTAVLMVPTTAVAAVAPGTSITYTSDADFDQGLLVNVNHDAPNGGQLQLNESGGTFPFIWIALSARGTVAKIDTRDGTVLGEFSASPDNESSNVSRTTVGLDGSVWAGNRATGNVIHVGLSETNGCIDRNGNGEIETSSGYGDVLAWPSGGVANAVDECILHYVDTVGGDARHVSVNLDGDIWVGSFSGGTARAFQLIDGLTGAILRTEPPAGSFNCGGYGGLVDGAGVIWSSSSSSTVLRYDPAQPLSAGGVGDPPENPRCVSLPALGLSSGYGMAIDSSGWIWMSSLSGAHVFKLAPDGNSKEGPFAHGSTSAQGLAVDGNDHVWVSSSLFCSSNCTIGHLLNDGTYVGSVPTPLGSGSTGIAVDAAGKVWAANINSSTATRIDPLAGPLGADGVTPVGEVDQTVDLPGSQPYNYSDMTGRVLLNATSQVGSWTVVQDSGEADTAWGTISLNDEPEGFIPPGGELSVALQARASNSEAGLGGEAFTPVDECASIEGLVGRYLQVRVTFRPNSTGQSPILSDLTVRTAERSEALGCEGPGSSGTPPPPAPLPSVPDDGRGVSTFIGAGGVVTTDTSNDGARPDDPVEVTVTSPNSGPVIIDFEDDDGSLDGFTFLGRKVDITAPDASSEDPLKIVFRLDGSVVPPGSRLAILRDGVPIGSCTGSLIAEPDPCITVRSSHGDDVIITILTSQASLWQFASGTPSACPTDRLPRGIFTDVDSGSAHAPAIDCAAWWGLARGEAGLFRPQAAITRGQLASMLVAMVTSAGRELDVASETVFTDVADHTHRRAIVTLAEAGLVGGRPDGSFQPDAEATRAQLATMITGVFRFLAMRELGNAESGFIDTGESVHAEAIDSAVAEGLLRGHTGTRFDPNSSATRAQVASVLTRALDALLVEGRAPLHE